MLDAGTSRDKAYFLQQRVLATTPRVSITEEQFSDLRWARRGLNEALSMEEAYSILIANYREFEGELVAISVGEMVGFDYSYDYFFKFKHEVSRRLVNMSTKFEGVQFCRR